MPELPEVETIACDLRERGLPGQVIERAVIRQPLVIRHPGAAAFAREVAGCGVEGVARHGKLLLIGLSNGATITVHLKMTGQLTLARRDEPVPVHTHAVFELGGERDLRFRDVRRFGYAALLDEAELRQALSSLGPDALAISEADFAQRLRSRRALLKSLLTQQEFVAGLGNIYANEMLFDAGINPWRRADRLSEEEAARLHASMRRVLEAAITCRGSSISDYIDTAGRAGSFQERHRVYRKEVCPRCRGKVVREVRGGRSAFYCPRCQPAVT